MPTLPTGSALPPKDHANTPTTNIQSQEKKAWAQLQPIERRLSTHVEELTKTASEMEALKGSAPSLKGRVSGAFH